MTNIEKIAIDWLTKKRDGDIEGIEVLPQNTCAGLVVWFYLEETGEDLPYFLTVPMVEKLLNKKKPLD